MYLHHKRGLGADRVAVIAQARAIGSADFDQPGAALAHDIRKPERVAYLDKLAAGYNDLSTPGNRGEHEQHGCRVVVDGHRGSGPSQHAHQALQVFLTRSPLTFSQSILEVAVSTGSLNDGIERIAGERSPSEVRMEHDPGRVDDFLEVGLHRGARGAQDLPGQRAGVEILRRRNGHRAIATPQDGGAQ